MRHYPVAVAVEVEDEDDSANSSSREGAVTMEEVPHDDRDRERYAGPERRESNSAWSDPRFLFTILTVFLAGLGQYYALSSRVATADVQRSAQYDELRTSVGEIRKGVDEIRTATTQLRDASTRQDERLSVLKDQAAQERQERQQQSSELKSWIDTLNNKVATLQAQQRH